MKFEVKRLKEAMWPIVLDPKARRVERIEAAKLIAACSGVLLPEIDEAFLSMRQVTELHRLKRTVVERALKKKARRKNQNRRAYLRRQIAALEGKNQQKETNGTTDPRT